MKFNPFGLLYFTPFKEDLDEVKRAKLVYTDQPLFLLGILGCLLLGALSFYLIMSSNKDGVLVLCTGLTIGALTAGFQWNAGLKANSLNQLYYILLTVAILGMGS